MATQTCNQSEVIPTESDAFDPALCIDHPSGFLALSRNNRFFTVENINGFIAYRDHGHHRISLGGVHAEDAVRGRLLDDFLIETKQAKLKPLMVQLPQSQVELCQQRGMVTNQLGATFALPLADYSFAGTRKMKLRNKIQRARKAGHRVFELGVDKPWNTSIAQQLRGVSEQWLGNKKKKELEFMIGEMDYGVDPRRRVFIVEDTSKKIVGFISYVPVWGRYPGYLHDLTRRLPDSPIGVMELCNASAMERMTKEKTPHLHFGFTPFIVADKEPAGANALVASLVRLLRRHGRLVYPADSQASYKLKWGADILEYEYIAGYSLSLRAVLDFMLLTKSL